MPPPNYVSRNLITRVVAETSLLGYWWADKGQKAKYAPPLGHVRSDPEYGSDTALSPRAERPAGAAEADRDVQMAGPATGAYSPRCCFMIMKPAAASMDPAL